jgi:uncharacterized oxidoreductase
MKLAGKKVLVTGGTAGIGAELVRQAREAGALVLTCARAAGDIRADLSTAEGRAHVAHAVPRDLDVLINNAGLQQLMDFRAGSVTAEAVALEVATNLTAPLELTRLLLPALLQRPEAMILNITSGLAVVPKASAPDYCATKAALRSFSKSLRWQLEGSSVRVVEALPPLVDTAMTAGRGANKLSAAECARRILQGVQRGQREIPVGQTWWLMAVARLSPSLAEGVMRRR